MALDALAGLLRVRVGDSGSDQLIAVRRSPSEVSTFRSHRPHRCPHPDTKAVALGPAEAAEEGQDDVVNLRRRIDRPLELWNPKLDVVVVELSQDRLDLSGVAEGTLGLTDDDP